MFYVFWFCPISRWLPKIDLTCSAAGILAFMAFINAGIVLQSYKLFRTRCCPFKLTTVSHQVHGFIRVYQQNTNGPVGVLIRRMGADSSSSVSFTARLRLIAADTRPPFVTVSRSFFRESRRRRWKRFRGN